jgi:anti-sigma regulatory factor (Ser/Thr protein kinase)
LVEPVALSLVEMSQVGEARRTAALLGARLGFDETGCGRIALVVTEAATNLVKHARDGFLILRPLEGKGGGGLEVLALDKGPGMVDLARCLVDGYSTAGTPGTGLGAIGRTANGVDVYSLRGVGTALVARLWEKPFSEGPGLFQIGVVSLPVASEQVCGDAWATDLQERRGLFLIADGLGHGPYAAQASREAVRIFRANEHLGPVDLLQTIHAALRSTRGAAVAVAQVDREARSVRYAGLGNIAGTILTAGASQSMVSHNGTAGHEARKFQEFVYPFAPGATLVMHSDGLGSRWNLGTYPELVGKDPGLIAGILYRDFHRRRDDATVLVARPAREAVA